MKGKIPKVASEVKSNLEKRKNSLKNRQNKVKIWFGRKKTI